MVGRTRRIGIVRRLNTKPLTFFYFQERDLNPTGDPILSPVSPQRRKAPCPIVPLRIHTFTYTYNFPYTSSKTPLFMSLHIKYGLHYSAFFPLFRDAAIPEFRIIGILFLFVIKLYLFTTPFFIVFGVLDVALHPVFVR